MTELMNITHNHTPTMSSREIAELVESRHDDVKRSIDRLVERGIIVQPPMADEPGFDAVGRSRPVKVSGQQARQLHCSRATLPRVHGSSCRSLAGA
jgi:phage regulator Rha-like protein